MAKVLKMGQDSATGSLYLFVGKVLSTFILAIGTIIVGKLILPSEYGSYTVALIPATTLVLFQDWGISSAITRNCAYYRSMQRKSELRQLIVTGLKFTIGIGLVLTILSLLLANFLASSLFGRPEIAFLVVLASPVIISMSLFTYSQSVFAGFERMNLIVVVIISQAVTQCVVSSFLVYIGLNALGALLGYAISYVIASTIAACLLYFIILRKLRPRNPDGSSKRSAWKILRSLLKFGIPLAIATLLGGLLTQSYSFIMALFIDDTMIANYRIALNFAVLLTFFTFPISTVLFPAFSKLDPQKEPQLLKTVYISSVKYTTLLLVPATMAIIVLSEPIMGTLYGDKWPFAPLFLSLYALTYLFVVFGSLSTDRLLIALGETTMVMKLSILTIAIGVPLAVLLIPQFGIVGLIIVNIIAGIPSMFIALCYGWKKYGARPDFGASAKIFLASVIAAVATGVILTVILTAVNSAYLTQLAIGITFFFVTFIVIAPLLGAISETDVNNLKAMSSGFGPVSKVIEIPLAVVNKLLKLRRQALRIHNQ